MCSACAHALRDQDLQVDEGDIALNICDSEWLAGEFLALGGRAAEAFACCEDLAGELGAVGGVVGDQERFTLAYDEGCDVHVVLCGLYGRIAQSVWYVGRIGIWICVAQAHLRGTMWRTFLA